MVKPDGLVLIPPEDIPQVMEDLPVQELCGIGPNLARALAAMGIRTCGELAGTPLRKLTHRFGIIGERLRNMGAGIDDDAVAPLAEQEAEESKSIGHSMTLEKDCGDPAALERHILQLSEKVGRRLRRGGYQGRTVTLTLRYADFRTFSRRKRLQHAVKHGLDIHATAASLMREITLEQPVRLVGVSVSDLDHAGDQFPLFDYDRRKESLSEVMDDINDRFGDFTVTRGTLAVRERHERIISPAWRPGGTREY
jgi:DNA polymerase-4